MDNQKTIKQLADELGVSKQAIRKHIDRLPETLLVTKKGTTIFLSDEVVAYIKTKVRKKSKEQSTKDTSNVSGKVTSNKEKVDSNSFNENTSLLEQLKVKDQQIEEKDNQINTLHKLLDQQQILTLQANKKIDELELKNESDEKIKSENDHTEEKNHDESDQNFSSTEIEKEKNNSTSFWKKLFRKEK